MSYSSLRYELDRLQILANNQAEIGKMSRLADKVQDIKPCPYREAQEVVNKIKEELIKAIEDNQADTPARQQAIKTIKGVV